jgi:hypothetical protein
MDRQQGVSSKFKKAPFFAVKQGKRLTQRENSTIIASIVIEQVQFSPSLS